MKIERRKLPGPRAAELLARDRKVASTSYPRDYPFVIERGAGTEVWDLDGHRFLDFAAGIAVCSTGHAHPQVVAALREQAGKFLHISSDFWHEPFTSACENLARIAPISGEKRVFLCNSGTESVEAAIKLARYHTKRPRYLGFHGGFHGRTMGALAFTASKVTQRRGFFPAMPGVTHLPYPDPYRPRLLQQTGESLGAATVRYLEDHLLRTECPPDEIAAIVVEPIQGEGGYVVPPDDFLPLLRRLCDRHGILLIADEVQSGMGRTGKFWAIEWNGVEPDILCSAKGIASGVPLGAMIARASVASWPPGAHGNTYGGNPLACVAANATIDVIEREGLSNATARGTQLLDGLRLLQAQDHGIGDVRGRGLMLGVEFVTNRATKEPAAARRDRIVTEAFHHGLLLLGCGRSAIRITPPLTVNAPECAEALEIFEHVLAAETAAG